ncbi:TPA: hypothetical protein ENG04_12515 [Candidatus Poribacteria bacterium]|nr:hypothetical protein [Candidatus Poribacteria bacterium]HEX30894.1 hypothetical protein [Candidatus Poribacteria bacterium]
MERFLVGFMPLSVSVLHQFLKAPPTSLKAFIGLFLWKWRLMWIGLTLLQLGLVEIFALRKGGSEE